MRQLVRTAIVILLATVSITIHDFAMAGVELVCKGSSARSNHTAKYVDCSDRQAVVGVLGAAWKTLRSQGIGGSTEDMCWDPYNRAKEIHPSIPFNNIAPTFFMQCNMALQYIK